MKKLMLVTLLTLTMPCFAGSYTANHTSKVSWVKIYNTDVIYFALDSMPDDHQCDGNFFILSKELTEKQLDRYYAMLLAARSSRGVITVGYDKTEPDCANGRPKTHSISY